MISGILDFFSRKNAKDDDFIKRDIAEMKANIKQLSEKVRVSDKNIETIYEAMSEILKELEKNSKEIANVSKSATSAIDSNSGQDSMAVKSQLSSMDAGMLEMTKKINEIMRVSRLAIQNHDEIKEIKRRMLSIKKGPSEKEYIEIENSRGGEFSVKESGVLNALLDSEIPLTYEEIAAQVNISPITVKGYINAIKKIKPDIILENTKGRGRKAYSIKSEYRIKVLSGKR